MSNMDFSNVPRHVAYKPISFVSAADKPSMIIGEQYVRSNGYLATVNELVEDKTLDPSSHTFMAPADLPANKVSDYNTRMRAIRDALATIAYNYREILVDCGAE